MSVKSGEMFKIDKGGEMNMDDGCWNHTPH